MSRKEAVMRGPSRERIFAPHEPVHFDLRDTIPFLLVRAYRALRHHLTESRWETGLYEGRDLVVVEIARQGGMATPGDLCEALDVRPPAMSELLRRARLAGYVERHRHPGDGRTWRLSLTRWRITVPRGPGRYGGGSTGLSGVSSARVTGRSCADCFTLWSPCWSGWTARHSLSEVGGLPARIPSGNRSIVPEEAMGTVALTVILVIGVVLVILLVPAIIGILIYNRLVALRVETDSSWADIDVQLKRRHDLIPNLVETVKGYAGHERETLESVTRARTSAVQATEAPPEQRAAAENVLTGALGRLFALAESYPQLRAAEPFQELQRSLSEVESDLQQARRYYNAVVRDLNTKVAQFPSNIVASIASIQAREFFEVEIPEQREAPRVEF
jgi:LemA protein